MPFVIPKFLYNGKNMGEWSFDKTIKVSVLLIDSCKLFDTSLLWMKLVTCFGFLTRQISQNLKLSLLWKNLATDLFFNFGFPPRVFYVRLNNILKSSPSIICLQFKSVILSKTLQRVDRLFNFSASLIALVRNHYR